MKRSFCFGSLNWLVLMSLVLSGCQMARVGKTDGAVDSRGEDWKKGFADASQQYAAKPGWNEAPGIPNANMDGARLNYTSVQISEPYLALTFDDGPHPSNTPRLLDILKKRNVKATFFVVGANVKAYPHIMKRMVAEGHEVANHTWTHADLTKVSFDKVRQELTTTRDAIVSATGIAPRVFRAPYGASNSSLRTFIKSEFGYPSIMWSVDPLDWKRPGASVVADRLVAGASNGGILLVHDIHAPTVDAMPSTLDRLLAKGYKFVTVSQLIELEQRGATAAAAGVDHGSPLPGETATVMAILTDRDGAADGVRGE